MKKLFILSLSILLTVSAAIAQDNNDAARANRSDSTRVRINFAQKAQALTDRMAKAYDLNDEQKSKLLQLNTRMLQPRGQRQMGKNPRMRNNAPQRAQDSAKWQSQRPKHQGQMRQGGRNQGRGNFYINALRRILTPEQMQAYMADKFMERALLGKQPGKQQMRRPAQHRHPRQFMHHRGHHGPRFAHPGHQPAKCGKHNANNCKADANNCKANGKKCKDNGKKCKDKSKKCKDKSKSKRSRNQFR